MVLPLLLAGGDHPCLEWGHGAEPSGSLIAPCTTQAQTCLLGVRGKEGDGAVVARLCVWVRGGAAASEVAMTGAASHFHLSGHVTMCVHGARHGLHAVCVLQAVGSTTRAPGLELVRMCEAGATLGSLTAEERRVLQTDGAMHNRMHNLVDVLRCAHGRCLVVAGVPPRHAPGWAAGSAGQGGGAPPGAALRASSG